MVVKFIPRFYFINKKKKLSNCDVDINDNFEELLFKWLVYGDGCNKTKVWINKIQCRDMPIDCDYEWILRTSLCIVIGWCIEIIYYFSFPTHCNDLKLNIKSINLDLIVEMIIDHRLYISTISTQNIIIRSEKWFSGWSFRFRKVHGTLKNTNFHWTVAIKSNNYP